MDCNKCMGKPKDVAEVLACSFCSRDGTANEIPKDLAPGAPLEFALERKPALGNRFTPERTPAPAEIVYGGEAGGGMAPTPTAKAEPKKAKQKAK